MFSAFLGLILALRWADEMGERRLRRRRSANIFLAIGGLGTINVYLCMIERFQTPKLGISVGF
jgi:hypothetical protein